MLGIVENLEVDGAQRRGGAERLVGAGVAGEARMRAAGDEQAEPVSRVEPMRGGVELEVEPPGAGLGSREVCG